MKENKRSYVYRHRRLDTNEIFYIGIGSKRTNRNYKENKNIYSRAYSDKRTIFWKRVVNKADYSVEIIKDNISWKEACELECLLISEYGRRDLNIGTLVNLTDGGEGSENISQEIINKIKNTLKGKFIGNNNPNYGNKWTEEQKKEMSLKKKGHCSGKSHYSYGKKKSLATRKKISENHNKPSGKNHYLSTLVLNTETGIFYYGIKEAANAHNIKYSTLRAKLSGYRNNDSNLIKI